MNYPPLSHQINKAFLLVLLLALTSGNSWAQKRAQEEIFLTVDSPPMPQGRLRGYYRYISNNLKYPAEAAKKKIEGRVFLQFVVEKDGSLTDIKLLTNLGYGCDEEAMRLIKNMPKWTPGRQNGVKKRTRRSITVNFKIWISKSNILKNIQNPVSLNLGYHYFRILYDKIAANKNLHWLDLTACGLTKG